MLETVLADMPQQLLQLRDFYDARASESIQGIIRKPAFSDVTAHFPGSIVGGESRKTHPLRLDEPDTCPESIFLAHGACDDFLEIHLHGTEKVLWQVGAVEAHCLVGIRSVVVIPIEE